MRIVQRRDSRYGRQTRSVKFTTLSGPRRGSKPEGISIAVTKRGGR